MNNILEIRDLQVHYGGIEAVKGISLDVPEGEIVTLIGANGAGKSSTLRAIAGLVKPSAGAITFQGEDITGKDSNLIVSRGITPSLTKYIDDAIAKLEEIRQKVDQIEDPGIRQGSILAGELHRNVVDLHGHLHGKPPVHIDPQGNGHQDGDDDADGLAAFVGVGVVVDVET